MTTLGQAGRVGAVVVIAVALFAVMWIFFKQGLVQGRTYTFDVVFKNARGADEGVDVQLAGVKIGKVDKVRLVGQRASLTLRIKKEYQIPHGSKFVITTPVLGSEGVVTVLPPPETSQKPGDVIRPEEANLVGQSSADISESFQQANTLLVEVTKTTKKADALIDETTRLIGNQKLKNSIQVSADNIAFATRNLSAASSNGVALTRRLNDILVEDNTQLQSLLAQTRSGAKASLGNITATTQQIREITTQNREKINAIVDNLNDTTSAFSGLLSQTKGLLTSNQIKATLTNLQATTDNLKGITDNLKATTGNFQTLSSDSSLQETLHNIRDTTARAALLLERLDTLAGVKAKTTTETKPDTNSLPRPRSETVPLLLPRAELLQNTRTNHFRLDLDAIVPLSAANGTFAQAGIYGFGDSNRGNLQYGKIVDKQGILDARFGLHASKLAAGLDLGLGRPATLSFDLYDVNKYHLDAHAVLMLNREVGLIVGSEDITRHTGTSVGLELRH